MGGVVGLFLCYAESMRLVLAMQQLMAAHLEVVQARLDRRAQGSEHNGGQR